ncbi:MAG TPA: NADH-quinone oxidoreductase subunit NuoN [Rhodocyclaceae bacterium]|nr:NADH-quinone oxidoreductase subunit NuoN [Rhodocyclaceae bacterium]
MFEKFATPDFLPAAPELFLCVMALVILMVDVCVRDTRQRLAFTLTVGTLVGTLLITLLSSAVMVRLAIYTFLGPDAVNDLLPQYIAAIHMPLGEQPVYTFSGMFVDDVMGDLLKVFLYLTMLVILVYSRAYVAEREQMAKGEFYVLALFATLGMMVMISANHFLTLYLGLELLSLSLYAMVAMNRDHVASTEAAMKYFVLGALASGFLLYGMSMIYGGTGSLEVTEISARLLGSQFDKTLLTFGLVFVVAGLAFKLGAVPFHMWVPDVYHGAPTAVTLFIGSAPKLAAFAILMRLLVGTVPVLYADWQSMLLVLAVLSMIIGNLVAIAQSNLKRMLAYSAIAHMGFMLLGISSGVTGTDAANAQNAHGAAMFYVLTYVLTTTAAFGVMLLLARAGFEADQLDDYKGLNRRSPWFAGMLLMVMFSMAGVPFFVGFFAKFSILQAVLIAGQYWVAIVAIVFSLIGAFYYLRVVKLMYFDAPVSEGPIVARSGMKFLLSLNAIAVAFLGLFPDKLLQMCSYALALSY